MLLILKHLAGARDHEGLQSDIDPGHPSIALILALGHIDCNRDEPPGGSIGHNCGENLASKAEWLSHIDLAELGNSDRVSVNAEFVVGEIERGCIAFL